VVVLVLGTFTGWLRADDEKPKVKLSDTEQKILDLTNQARQKENLPPLKPNPTLFEVARAHSANMAKQGKMEHVLDGKNPAQRLKETGYTYASMAENVAMGLNTPVATIFKSWMDSKLHRENILNGKLEEIGIGAARAADGTWYYTQEFGTPLKQP
jgi:uncharacterized protein YkwD